MEEKYFESTIIALRQNANEFTAVNLSGHSLNDEKMIKLADALSVNTHVDTLELHEVTGVTVEGWSRLIHTLDLSCCKLNQDQSFIQLSEALKGMKAMQELDLSGNDIEDVPESFCVALTNMDQLSELIIHGNNLKNDGCIKVCKSISPKAPLYKIWLQNNGIDLAGKEAISQIMAASNASIVFGNV